MFHSGMKAYLVYGPSGGAQTRGLVIPNHARYRLRHTW